MYIKIGIWFYFDDLIMLPNKIKRKISQNDYQYHDLERNVVLI